MAEVEALYLKSQEKEKAAEAKTTAQNRNLYDGYMQEIDPYGEFAEKIAKKGLTKSGYPQYDYEGFKKAFETQTGDNMQNLRQLKAEIRAALQLAIATENEKLEEALLNYRTNLAKLEQEYLGQSRMGDETVADRSESEAAEYNEAEPYGMGGALEDGVHKVLQDYTDENGELLPAGSFIISQNTQEMVIKPDDSNYAMFEAAYNEQEDRDVGSGWEDLFDKIAESVDWAAILKTDDKSVIQKIISNIRGAISRFWNKDMEEGLHLVPDGSYDDEGNPLPEGTYVRVVNGKKYYVTRDDPRYGDIVQEYYDANSNDGEYVVFYDYDSEVQRYIRYENIDGVIYKDGKEMPESKSKYLPTQVGGSRLPYEENVAGTAGTNRNNTEWYTPEYKSVNAGFGGYQNAGSANGSHIGLDITITGDQMVRNITAGTVTNLNFNTSNGFYVIMQHEIDGIIYYSFYAHMDNGVTNTSKAEQQKLHNICKKEQSGHKLTEEEKQYKDEMFAKVVNVAIGDEIPAGTILGPMGSTGTSTNEHVHIGVYSGRVSGSPYGTYKEPNAEGKNEYRALTEEEKQRGYIDRDGLRFYDVLKVIDSHGQIIAENPFMN